MRIDLFWEETFWGAEHERERKYGGLVGVTAVTPDRGGQG